jgi:hypothetical protein
MQFNIIHRYPAFRVEMASVAASVAPPKLAKVCPISAHAAMMELITIKPNEKSANGVTEPPNQRTSPYAIKMIVRFLKMVYIGMERYCRAFAPV